MLGVRGGSFHIALSMHLYEKAANNGKMCLKPSVSIFQLLRHPVAAWVVSLVIRVNIGINRYRHGRCTGRHMNPIQTTRSQRGSRAIVKRGELRGSLYNTRLNLFLLRIAGSSNRRMQSRNILDLLFIENHAQAHSDSIIEFPTLKSKRRQSNFTLHIGLGEEFLAAF